MLPHAYRLGNNQTVDVAFVKLYLSTKGVKFSGVVQESPFLRKEHAKKREAQREITDTWDAIVIPVIQRKILEGN